MVEGGGAIVDVAEVGAGWSGTQLPSSIMMSLLKSTIKEHLKVTSKG